jgi:nicotinamidase-related amidase
MTLFRTVLVTSGLLALCGGVAQSAQNAAPNRPMMTLQMPATPEPARVTLNPRTTALMVLDYVEDICNRQPSCSGKMLPAMTPFMDRVRKAGLTVAYGTRQPNMDHWLKEVAPTGNDIKIINVAQDRFYNTDLDAVLKAKGITTLILTGWKVSGSVTYTSVAATLRGYTVVVPVDTSLDQTDFEIAVGRHQILNQTSSNANNEPLKERASTLSRTDLITFK